MGQLMLYSGTEGGKVVSQPDRRPSFFVWQGKSGSSASTQDKSDLSVSCRLLLWVVAGLTLLLCVIGLLVPAYRVATSAVIQVMLVTAVMVTCLEYRNEIVVDFPGAKDIWLEEEIAEHQAKVLQDHKVTLVPLYSSCSGSDATRNTAKTFDVEAAAVYYTFYGYTANGSVVLRRLERVYSHAMRMAGHPIEQCNLWLGIADQPKAIDAVSMFYFCFLPIDDRLVDERCMTKAMRMRHAETLQQLDVACENLVRRISAIQASA